MRHYVFTSDSAREPICVAEARDKVHAVAVARRQGFKLERTAYARLESRGELEAFARTGR
jgi:hypothetical protein